MKLLIKIRKLRIIKKMLEQQNNLSNEVQKELKVIYLTKLRDKMKVNLLLKRFKVVAKH